MYVCLIFRKQHCSSLLKSINQILFFSLKIYALSVCHRKDQAFLQFTINSQSKLKKFSKVFLRHLLRKNLRFQGGVFQLEFLAIFTTAFLIKTYLNLNLFQVLQSALLKNKKISSQKRFNPPRNCLTQQETKKKKKKEKRKMGKSQQQLFLFLHFYIEKFIFCQKTCLEKLTFYF